MRSNGGYVSGRPVEGFHPPRIITVEEAQEFAERFLALHAERRVTVFEPAPHQPLQNATPPESPPKIATFGF